MAAPNAYPWLKKPLPPHPRINAPVPSPRRSKARRLRSHMFSVFTFLSYFKLNILCIPPCYWPFGWPRLPGSKKKHEAESEVYLDYEESTNEKRSNKLAAKKFIVDHDLQGFDHLAAMPGQWVSSSLEIFPN